MKVALTTKAEIIEAVDAGKDVYCDGGGYKVIKDSIGQYFIKFLGNGHLVYLSGQDGTPYENVLNARGFYYEQSEVVVPTENTVVAETISEYKLSKTKSDFKRVKIKGVVDSADYIRQFYGEDIGIYESAFILLLNRSNETIGYAKISQGGVCGTVVDPMIVAKYAVDALAVGVVIAHNHPTGNLKPSDADKKITEQLRGGLELLNIRLLDHIILCEEGFFSFSNEGYL